jgi:integrase/recombinase XerC
MRDFVIEAQRRYDRRTLHNHVSGLRTFFKFWLRRGRLQRNPWLGVPLPRLEKRLPKFLTEDQTRQLLTGPQRLLENGAIDAFCAWRDRLVMELLYGGGLRVSELVALNHGAIDPVSGVARVVRTRVGAVLLDETPYVSVQVAFGEFFKADPAQLVQKVDETYAALQRVRH